LLPFAASKKDLILIMEVGLKEVEKIVTSPSVSLSKVVRLRNEPKRQKLKS